jgi:hypothetical protein
MAKKNPEPQTIEGEVIESRSQALQVSPPANIAMLSPVVDLATAQRQLAEFQTFVASYLVEGTEGEGDFGTLPGTKRKCLHQSGAHKLAELFGFAPTFPDNRIRRTERWDMTPPLFDYEVTCVLWRKGTQFVIAEGLGSCSSYETKYKYRQGERKCPSCNQATIIKGKAEYGGGWLCFKKKGGCGAKFEDGDQAIETQTVSRVLNEDMADSKNTILKIAVKRALVSAVIAATRSSGIFTPDMEHAEGSAPEVSAGETSQPASSGLKTKKFAGTVIDAQRIDAGDHQVLVLKLRYAAKRKGKDGKWTTVTEETIVVAEQSNFMRLLERSRDTKIEVECSQQAGGKGKAYWRIEKLISGGTEPPASETKAPETKPAEGKTMPKATDPCQCGHVAGDHAYGSDACSMPACACKAFVAKSSQRAATASPAEKPASAPVNQPSAQPASSPAQPATSTPTPVIVGKPPVVAKVQRNLVMAGGKKKAVEWLQVRGKVRGFGWSKDNHGVYQLSQAPTVATTSKRSEYIAVVLEGLPQWPENQKGGHDLFLCWHKSLFECMKTLKVGDTFIFCYEQETVADGRVYLQLEDIEFINGVEYLNGKPALPAAGEVSK